MNPNQKAKLKCVLKDGCKATGRLAMRMGAGCQYCAVGEILHFVGVPDDWLMKVTSIASAIKLPNWGPFIKDAEEKFGLAWHQMHTLEGVNDANHHLDERHEALCRKLDQITPD